MKLYILLILSALCVFSKGQMNSSDFLLEVEYEPKYYRLEINLNPNQSEFYGKTTLHFKTNSGISQFQIHAQPNLIIEEINYHSETISDYSRDGNVLSFHLPQELPQNHIDSLSIQFSGSAESSTGLNLGYHSTVPIIETLSEPWHASSWWVCKDDLLEKAEEIDVFIQHPQEFKAASNGTLISITDLGNGNHLTHWKHKYPIPAYLLGIAVSNYVEYNNSVQIGDVEMPIINYLYPEALSQWTSALDAVPTYIEFLNEKLGNYPFKNEKYGHAQWNRNGGMEHTTMSFMGKFTFSLVVHELAHQWFGNKVTCKSWSDIWINEGFADYCVGLLDEFIHGEESFKNWKNERVNLITSLNHGSVYVPENSSQSRIFDSRLTYKKASMVVHLIRFILNDDELFFQVLRNFLNKTELSFSYASTQDFKEVLESSTQQNWDDFFQDWIYGEGHPIITTSLQTIGSNVWLLEIQQQPSHQSVNIFRMPIEIEFRGDNNQKEIRRFELSQEIESFLIHDLQFEPIDYVPNPGNDLVCVLNVTPMKSQEWTKSSILIHPIPAKNEITIQTEEPMKVIEIYNLKGQMKEKINIGNQTKIKIQTDSWTKGVYLLKIKLENSIIEKKIIVE